MDLLKDEQKLIDKKHKARDNVDRKRKYFTGAQTSFRKARREFKVAAKILQAFRKKHKFELEDLRAELTDLVVIHTPGVIPTPVEEKPIDFEEPETD